MATRAKQGINSAIGTPKRRLSLNSIDTPSSDDSCVSLEKSTTLSTESGVFVDSPTLLDSPTLESYAHRYKPNIPLEAFTKKKTIAFRRINSLPTTPYFTQTQQSLICPVTISCIQDKGPPTLRLDCDSPTEFLDGMETGEQCSNGPTMSTNSCPASSSICKEKMLLEESNSQDSGVSLDKDPGFKIPAPVGLIRRKSRLNEISEETCSPHKYSPVKSPQKRSLSFCLGSFKNSSTDGDSPIRLKRSSLTSNSADEDDDGFLDLVDQEVSEINGDVPEGLSSLFNEPVLNKPSNSKEEAVTPVSRRILPAKRFLQRSQSVDIQSRQFKRSEPPDILSGQSKRWKSAQTHDDFYTADGVRLPARRLQRCHSETEAMIKSAVHRLTEEPDLIADSSKPYILPTIRGKHQDLKSISHETLSELIQGEYADQVEDFHVIDCRYPYEFEGGHIQNALNIYTREVLVEHYLKIPKKTEDPNKRFLLVFHCEFSSERGPNLYRFLRSQDRESNKECYPCLHYPEIYLLEGGYKTFFEHHKVLCQPQMYRQMLNKEYSSDLRKFRAKSKSWAGEKSSSRSGLRNLKF